MKWDDFIKREREDSLKAKTVKGLMVEQVKDKQKEDERSRRRLREKFNRLYPILATTPSPPPPPPIPLGGPLGGRDQQLGQNQPLADRPVNHG